MARSGCASGRTTTRHLRIVILGSALALVWWATRPDPPATSLVPKERKEVSKIPSAGPPSLGDPAQATADGEAAPHRRLPDELAGDVQADSWLLATPGCGYSIRELSLPERRAIPVEDQTFATEMLEELRAKLVTLVGPVDGLDDELYAAGAIGGIRARWETLPRARRRDIIAALHAGTELKDPVFEQVRQVTAETQRHLALLAAGLTSDALDVWSTETLSWCAVTLTEY